MPHFRRRSPRLEYGVEAVAVAKLLQSMGAAAIAILVLPRPMNVNSDMVVSRKSDGLLSQCSFRALIRKSRCRGLNFSMRYSRHHPSGQLEIWQEFFRKARCDASKNSPLFEIALALVRLHHVASFIVNANHSIV